MIKGIINQEAITIIITYAFNIETHIFKTIINRMKEEEVSNTIIIEGFNSLFSTLHRSLNRKQWTKVTL